MVVLTAAAITAGTVVTGTGPHAGDERARRFTFFSINWAARIHSSIVWLALASAVWLLWWLRSRPRDREALDAPFTAWLCIAVGQGVVGYLQYAQGVPAPLVAVHVALATALCTASVWLWCATRTAERLSVAEAASELRQLVDGGREERAD